MTTAGAASSTLIRRFGMVHTRAGSPDGVTRRMEVDVLEREKVLITGATGKIAFPIARALAARNDVWGGAPPEPG